MALITKLKEIMPWKRKPVETHEVMSLRDDINQLFDKLLMAPFDTQWPTFGSAGPGLEVDENDEHVTIRAEVPGLDPKQLKVEVRNGMLQVSYEHETEWRANNGEGSGRRAAWADMTNVLAIPPGTSLVDDFRIEKVLGAGGFGNVWSAPGFVETRFCRGLVQPLLDFLPVVSSIGG